jgi:formate dehydrogenase subunit delta
MSSGERLVTMANQIARNLAVRGEAVAVEETAGHIRKFWDPWMIKGLKAADTAGLEPIARAALAQLEERV